MRCGVPLRHRPSTGDEAILPLPTTDSRRTVPPLTPPRDPPSSWKEGIKVSACVAFANAASPRITTLRRTTAACKEKNEKQQQIEGNNKNHARDHPVDDDIPTPSPRLLTVASSPFEQEIKRRTRKDEKRLATIAIVFLLVQFVCWHNTIMDTHQLGSLSSPPRRQQPLIAIPAFKKNCKGNCKQENEEGKNYDMLGSEINREVQPEEALLDGGRTTAPNFDFGPAVMTNTPNNSSAQIALFLHIFINPRKKSQSWDIVNEMLEARKQSPSVKDSVLHYSTIGGDPNKNTTIPPHLCGDSSSCHHIGHFEKGFEHITLEALYQYCHLRPKDRVVYFHNKGSYNAVPENHRLRKHLIKGIFSNSCRRAISSKRFDLCCTKFIGIPMSHCLGNFFVTSCEYVRRLHSPVEFARRRREIHEDMMQELDNKTRQGDVAVFHIKNDTIGTLRSMVAGTGRSNHSSGIATTTGSTIMMDDKESTKINQESASVSFWMNNATIALFGLQSAYFKAMNGLDRFSAEHWVGSHPSLRPVNVIPPRIHLNYITDISHSFAWRPKLSTEFTVYDKKQKEGQPFHRLEGRLYLYERLYSEFPSKDSWVWHYYLPS